MWVYEGQTEYWGEVLTPRAGLGAVEEATINLARSPPSTTISRSAVAIPAGYDQPQPSGYRTTNPWSSWMRGTGDYYREALLVWLGRRHPDPRADGERKSLDDFAKAFFGVEDGVWEARPYTFDDVVQTLNAVHPHDWASFLRDRLDAVGPEAKAPLDGVTRAGWRLTYTTRSPGREAHSVGWANDFQYSLGFTLATGNRITGVRWDGPLYRQNIGAGWELIAVNDRVASAEVLRDAVTAAKGGTDPVVLVVRRGRRGPQPVFRLPRRPALPAAGAYRGNPRPSGRHLRAAAALEVPAGPWLRLAVSSPMMTSHCFDASSGVSLAMFQARSRNSCAQRCVIDRPALTLLALRLRHLHRPPRDRCWTGPHDFQCAGIRQR
jgi:hypothetical protein